jgi:nitroreductase
MELIDAVRRRRMVRTFEPRPVAPELVDRLIDLARRSPSAGNTQPWSFVVLEGREQVSRLWDVTFPVARRSSFRFPGLFDAPVVVVPLVSPDAYLERYAETDKSRSGLGEALEDWAVPYWWIDGGMAVHAMLLGATDMGLGALFYGLFDHELDVLDLLGVPEGWRALGGVALGWPAAGDEPGRSIERPRRDLHEVVHRGGWRPG